MRAELEQRADVVAHVRQPLVDVSAISFGLATRSLRIIRMRARIGWDSAFAIRGSDQVRAMGRSHSATLVDTVDRRVES